MITQSEAHIFTQNRVKFCVAYPRHFWKSVLQHAATQKAVIHGFASGSVDVHIVPPSISLVRCM